MIHWLSRRTARAGMMLGAAAAAALGIAPSLVPFPEDKIENLPVSAVIADRNGEPLRVKLGAGGFDCRPGYEPDPGDWIAKAIVAAEDRRFWKHSGVDAVALARAIAQNLGAGRRVSGASTLTTQVIRMAEPRRRTLGTKAIEAFRAAQLERRRGKAQILAYYLNRAPFGGNLVGIEAAARRYFGKGAGDLSLAEAALLAGLPQSPSRLRPDRHPERAKRRQAYVLERMEACGYVTAREKEEALAQKLEIRRGGYPFRAPHFCDMVGVPARPAAGSEIRTTLDLDLQETVEGALRRRLTGCGADGGAVVVLDAKTGAVRALVGSPDYGEGRAGQVNAALSARSAGSTLKPFAYALAFDGGYATPATRLADVPARFRDYDPSNFSPEFRGWTSAREALVLSLNLPALDVQARIGQKKLYATLRELGLSSLDKPADHYGLGLVLGGAEVRLLELANAYAALARGGEWAPPHFVETGEPIAYKRVFSAEACWLVADALSGDERAMDATGHAADVRLPPIAWKTGTSAGLRDAWTIAWNPELVVGVWVGNADGRPSEALVGREIATPIAWDVFRRIYPDNRGPEFARPAGVVTREACAESGCAPGARCGHVEEDWSIAKVSRHEPCRLHAGGTAAAMPTAVASYLNRRTEGAGAAATAVRILTPAGGSRYRQVPEGDGIRQRLAFDAETDAGAEVLHWFVNDRPVGRSVAGQPFFWPLEKGEHQIVCASARGPSDRVKIAVE